MKLEPLTLFPSSQRVTMTMIDDCCSQTILQKSLTVSSFGPITNTNQIVWRFCCKKINKYEFTLSCNVFFGFFVSLQDKEHYSQKTRIKPC